MKIVRAIRQGRIVPNKPATTKPQYYQLWATPASDHPPPLPAPKPSLPVHSESYNPPEEYVPTAEEKASWLATDKEDREKNYLPSKYPSLRLVPAYDQFIQERFSRLLDLYLAPRIQRKKLNINPDSMLPSLPSPQSLKPFPIFESLRHRHDARARCVAVSPDGIWIASGDEDGLVKVWETIVGREAARYKFEGRIGSIAWCPRDDVNFFLVGVCVFFPFPFSLFPFLFSLHLYPLLTLFLSSEDAIHAMTPPYLSPAMLATTLALLNPANPPQALPATSAIVLKWADQTEASTSQSPSPVLTVAFPAGSGVVRQLTFHRRGDYFASICQ